MQFTIKNAEIDFTFAGFDFGILNVSYDVHVMPDGEWEITDWYLYSLEKREWVSVDRGAPHLAWWANALTAFERDDKDFRAAVEAHIAEQAADYSPADDDADYRADLALEDM